MSLLHALLSIGGERDLATHNKLGASWEGFAVETAIRSIGKRPEDMAFWATHTGAEVDLFWQEHGRNWAVEMKYGSSPAKTPSMASAIKDLELAHLWVMYPGDKAFALGPNISALPVASMPPQWRYPE
jgi:uncharacterized protein